MVNCPGVTPSATVPASGGKNRARGIARWQVIGVLLIAAFAVIGGYWATHSEYHYAIVQPGILYRDGCEHLRQLSQTVARAHPKTVVSLVDDDEVASSKTPQFQQEAEYLKQQGIRLERIPIRRGGWPTDDQVRQFIALVSTPENQPVLVHCAQGVHRTGIMVAAYQMAAEHFDPQRAKDAVLTFGHSDRTISDVKRFIDHFDPQRQTVTTAPSAGAGE